MNEVDSWQDALNKEKSLFQIYLASLKLPKSQFNTLCRYLSPIFSAIIVFSIQYYKWDTDFFFPIVGRWAALIVSVSTGLLGFLVTGFAIFCSFSDRSLLVELAKTNQIGTNVSVFKYLFFNFLSVFVVFLVAFSTSITILLISDLNIQVPDVHYSARIIPTSGIINCVILIIFSTLVTEMIVKLKSFIWNIYETFLTMVTVSDFLDVQREKQT